MNYKLFRNIEWTKVSRTSTTRSPSARTSVSQGHRRRTSLDHRPTGRKDLRRASRRCWTEERGGKHRLVPLQVRWLVSTVPIKDHNARTSRCSPILVAFESRSTTSWPRVKSTMQTETTSARNALFKSSISLPCLHCLTKTKTSTLPRDKDRARAKVSKARSKFHRLGTTPRR